MHMDEVWEFMKIRFSSPIRDCFAARKKVLPARIWINYCHPPPALLRARLVFILKNIFFYWIHILRLTSLKAKDTGTFRELLFGIILLRWFFLLKMHRYIFLAQSDIANIEQMTILRKVHFRSILKNRIFTHFPTVLKILSSIVRSVTLSLLRLIRMKSARGAKQIEFSPSISVFTIGLIITNLLNELWYLNHVSSKYILVLMQKLFQIEITVLS